MGKHEAPTDPAAPVGGPTRGAFDRIGSQATVDAIAELISDNHLTYTWVLAEKIQTLIEQIAADTQTHEYTLVDSEDGDGWYRPLCECGHEGFPGTKDSAHLGGHAHQVYVGWAK